MAGRAYVFRFDGSQWAFEAELTPASGAVGDRFGASVSVWGDRAVVGAPGAGDDAGDVFVFERTDEVWTETAALGAVGLPTPGGFGSAVDVEGSTIVAGAPLDDRSGAAVGSASVFRPDASGAWTRSQVIDPVFVRTASHAGTMDPEFGCRISLSGTGLAISACGAELRQFDEGVISIYRRTGLHFQLETQLRVGTSAGHFRRWGQALALDGDNLLAGCWRAAHTADGRNWGDAFLFERIDGTWTKNRRIVSRSQFEPDHFASSVAMDEASAVFGAPFDDRAASNAGALYVEDGVGLPVPAPSITPSVLAPLAAGQSIDLVFELAGATPPVRFDPVVGDLPVDGAFDAATGSLAGTTRAPGTYAFTVSGVDGEGRRATADLVVEVRASDALSAVPLPVAVVARRYRAAIELSTLAGDTTWSMEVADLPPGLVHEPQSNVISGVPTASGRFDLAVTARDVTGTRVESVNVPLHVEAVVDLSSRRHVERIGGAEGETEVVRVVELIAGTRMDVVVKSRVGTALGLTIVDNDEQPVDLGKRLRRTRSGWRVKGLPVPTTGRYAVRLTKPAGADARLRVSVRAPTRFSGTADVALGVSHTVALSTLPGTLVEIVARPVRGSTAIPSIDSLRDDAAGELLGPGAVRLRGRRAVARAVVPLGGGGDLSLDVSALALSSGEVRWTVRLRLPAVYPFHLPDLGVGD